MRACCEHKMLTFAQRALIASTHQPPGSLFSLEVINLITFSFLSMPVTGTGTIPQTMMLLTL